MKLLFTDIETTGFDSRWDYIIEIAAILYDTETDQEVARFHEYIKPGKTIPPHITDITGISNEKVATCRDEDDVMRDFIEFLAIVNPDAIVGHNLDAFDRRFIIAKNNKYFLDSPNLEVIKTIDTLKLAREIKPPTGKVTKKGRPSYSQESIAMGYGIKYNAHSAIADVQALILIYKRLIEKQEANKIKKRKNLGF